MAIEPGPLHPVKCLARGAALGVSACALSTGLPFAIAERKIAVVHKDLGWSECESYVGELPDDRRPGNILLLKARFEHATEIVSGFGRLGVPAESLAHQAAARMRGYLACAAFAGPYLTDQLLLPMAVAGGGAFTTVKPSAHARTAAAVIECFTGRRTSLQPREAGDHLVTVA